MVWIRIVVASLLFLGGNAAWATPMAYIFPPPESTSDQRMDYYWELLRAALDATSATWGPYSLGASPVQMNAARSQTLLERAQTITVLARTTSAEREQSLLPLRIPLDKGLTGYRLFLIQEELQPRLHAVQSLDDLKAFSIGQGVNWIDVEILRDAGLTVETGANYAALFKMLQIGRFELFSRGINEIRAEYLSGRQSNPHLRIEDSLLLYYPLPRYFFFSPNAEGEQLAQRAEEGLRLLQRNGEFERRYQAFKRTLLSGLSLSGRTVLRISNPTLSPKTPLAESGYWDTLETELKSGTRSAVVPYHPPLNAPGGGQP